MKIPAGKIEVTREAKTDMVAAAYRGIVYALKEALVEFDEAAKNNDRPGAFIALGHVMKTAHDISKIACALAKLI